MTATRVPGPARTVSTTRSGPANLFAAAYVLTMAGPVVIAISQAVGMPHVWLHPTIALIFFLSVVPRFVNHVGRPHRPRWDALGACAGLALLTYALIASSWSPQPDFASDKATAMLYLCILPALSLAAARLRSEDHTKRVDALARASRFVLAISLASLLVFGQTGAGGRLVLGDVNPIWFARGLVMLGIAASVRTRRSSPLWAVSVALACIVLGSRSAALVMMAVLVHSFRGELSVVAHRRKGRFIRMVPGFAVAAAVTYYLMIVGVLRAPDDFSAISRSRLWEAAIDQLRFDSSLLNGQGLAAFQNVLSSRYSYPHNLVLEMLLELGLFAVVGLAFLLRRGIQNSGTLLRVSLVASFMMAMTSGDFAGNGSFFALLITANYVRPKRQQLTLEQ